MKLHFDETIGQIRDETEFPIAHIDRLAHERFPDLARQMAAGSEMLALVKEALSLAGGWREAIVELEDHCSEPVRLRNMLAAADQLDRWTGIAHELIERVTE